MKNNKGLMKIDLPLPKLKGETKVREVYDTSDFENNTLLIVTTDRISAYDVVMKSPIDKKGEYLNRISSYWFKKTKAICPNHFISDQFDSLPSELKDSLASSREKLEGRIMYVKKASESFPAEFIVRGFLLGSAWVTYQETGEICGIKLPKNLKKGDKLPAPIFTPSTKEEYGRHDENITFVELMKLINPRNAKILRAYSLSVYCFIANEAFLKGIEITDTKFEFGILASGGIAQIDEIGTPDSSRYVPDYSKQPFRDWLTSINYDKRTPLEIPEDVASQVSDNYSKACEIITG